MSFPDSDKKASRFLKKKWLMRYRELSRELDRETEQAGYWRDKAEGLSPPRLDGYGIPSANRKSMADYVASFLDLARECSELGRQAETSRQEILKAINRIDDQNCREVLRLVYIDGLDFISVSQKMHFTPRWIRKLHQKALDELEI